MARKKARPLALSTTLVATLATFGAIGAALFSAGRRDYPGLHTVLDTSAFLLSAVLALLFWDMGRRLDNVFAKLMAVAFSFTGLLEFAHALVTIEWAGPLAPVAAAVAWLRPATWPPPAHLLPLGIGGSVLLMGRGGRGVLALALSLALLSASLLGLFLQLPRYAPPGWLGISRPTLLFVPVLCAAAGAWCWRLRTADRLLPTLALMTVVLLAGHLAMLYSRAPHDTQAMIAHLGKVGAYLVVLLSVMEMASTDMAHRIQAERQLAELNKDLEQRVLDRTARLAAEVAERQRAEDRVRAQLERLDLLHQITRAIGVRQDLASIYQVVLRSLEESLPFDFGCICDYDGARRELQVLHVGTRSRELALELALSEHAHVPIDENGLSRCVSGHLVYEPDVDAVQAPFPQRLAGGGLRAFVAAPLLVESKVFGVLVVARRETGSFSSGECEFLRQLSEHVALAAHQSQLTAALQKAYDDLRQTQESVMHQERLRALGQMASGIAHDINNALSPVALYADALLEKEQHLSPRGRADLKIISRAVDDVAQTVGRMREFYRQREPQMALTEVDLGTLIGQVVDLSRARWGDMPQQRGIVITIAREVAADTPSILGVESELREALINLIFNAVDAMPAGGTLTLRAHGAERPSDAVADALVQQVHVEVCDTGVGMDEGTRVRCLEPFFTTKGDRGTGLGLAMVYGVVQRHGAEIEIESAVGHGTTMRLVFPAPTGAAAAPQPPVGPAPVVQRLRILLVDDDPVVIEAVRHTLEGDGHVVITADGGQAGIDTFGAAVARGQTFDVVITDLGMPHVDGGKVASAVKARSPRTTVILLTGWGRRLVADDEVPPYVDRVLSKPPRLSELRDALSAVTTASSGTG